jgi:transcriptional regulator with XRE-family HTH domain
MRINARMEELEITQSELSRLSGLTPVSIHYYCTGKTIPKADAVVKLAHGLNMTTDDLINFQV